MTDESLTTPEKLRCNHRWKVVEGATSSKGGRVLVCEICTATMEPDPPVKEKKRDSRPLLME
jgi:hypothetical protein